MYFSSLNALDGELCLLVVPKVMRLCAALYVGL